MTSWNELWLFAGVMALGQFSPGPDMILLTRTAMREGARHGVCMALGIACGLGVHATVAVAGLAVAFEKFQWLRLGLRWLAGLYLLWLAWGLIRAWFSAWRGHSIVSPEGSGDRKSPFLRGLICNLLNPKAALFLAAVCAPFLSGAPPPGLAMALWAIVVFQSALLWSVWARLLQWAPVRSRYENATGWIDGIFGVMLLVLAVRVLAR